MLILTRRVGETVMIGNDVTVTILGVKGNQVRVGVNAPRDVAVHREEIFERIKREEQGEAGPAPSSTRSAVARASNGNGYAGNGADHDPHSLQRRWAKPGGSSPFSRRRWTPPGLKRPRLGPPFALRAGPPDVYPSRLSKKRRDGRVVEGAPLLRA